MEKTNDFFEEIEVKPKDLHKIKEKYNISIEPRQIFYIFIIFLIVLSCVFFAGYYSKSINLKRKQGVKFSKMAIKEGFAREDGIKIFNDSNERGKKRAFRKGSVLPYIKIPIRKDAGEKKPEIINERKYLDTVIVKKEIFNVFEEFLPPPIIQKKEIKQVFNIIEEFLPPPIVIKCPEKKEIPKDKEHISSKNFISKEEIIQKKKSPTPLIEQKKTFINPDGNKSVYSIQIRSFLNLKEAEDFVEELKRKGLKPYITIWKENEERTWFRVRTGWFKTLNNAKEYLALLKQKEGFEESIIFSPEQK